MINFLSSFSDVRFEALFTNSLPQKRIDSIVNSPWLHKISLTTKDGKSQEIKTFTKLVQLGGYSDPSEVGGVDRDRMYGLINDGQDLVLIQYYIFDKLLKDVDYYEAGHPIQYEIGHYEVYE